MYFLNQMRGATTSVWAGRSTTTIINHLEHIWKLHLFIVSSCTLPIHIHRHFVLLKDVSFSKRPLPGSRSQVHEDSFHHKTGGLQLTCRDWWIAFLLFVEDQCQSFYISNKLLLPAELDLSLWSFSSQEIMYIHNHISHVFLRDAVKNIVF